MDDIKRDARIEYWYPSVLANAKEFIELGKAVDPELNSLYKVLNEWFFNTFIWHTDLLGIQRWEDMLSLYPDENATMTDRRAAIFMAVNGTAPYTERSFEALTDGMYHKGAVTVAVEPNSYTVILHLADDVVEKVTDIFRYARLIIPANMTIQTAHTTPIAMPHYVGAVVRRRSKIEVGRLTGDKVNHYAVCFVLDKDIHEYDSDGNINISLNGIKSSKVMWRKGNLVSPNPKAAVGDEDDFFKVDTDGYIKAK